MYPRVESDLIGGEKSFTFGIQVPFFAILVFGAPPHSRDANAESMHTKYLPILLLSLCLLPRTAIADHAKRARPLDSSPYTLDPTEVRVGLQTVEVGLWGHPLLELLDLGVSPLTYLAYGAGIKAASVHGKYEMYRDDTLSLSVSAGVNWLDFRDVGVPARFFALPLAVYTGVRLSNSLTLTAGLTHTKVKLRAEGKVGPIDKLGGAVGTESLLIRSALLYRLSNRTLLSVDIRYAGFQSQFAEAEVDPNTDNDKDGVYARVESDLIGGEKSFTFGTQVHWSWKRFNLELGVEYGTYVIPLINFIVPTKTIAPRVDFYWRF